MFNENNTIPKDALMKSNSANISSEAAPEVKTETETDSKAYQESFQAVVSNCHYLNVRRTPTAVLDDNVLLTIPSGTELTVFPESSTRDFLKVCLEDGTLGFCMRDFIENK